MKIRVILNYLSLICFTDLVYDLYFIYILAGSWPLAKVAATINGKTTVASA
jgi:hypothetical protein